ncbi:DUF6197 family protein [Azospirillum canadense]|uniref:DUF6197 family protein n=1 Tax=Azospirillum canadense TaxID=403962 RepID=UPI002225E03A|nr:hypothetical protein [Azospirillum canadense]MCW2242312.1 hypothetical protein [Azospirillum canadense]
MSITIRSSDPFQPPKNPPRKGARPTALAVLTEMLAIIKRRGWKHYSFEDIRDGRAQWWLTEAETTPWPIDMNHAIDLAHRTVYGHPQVPAIYKFWTPIESTLDKVVGESRLRWECAQGRTHDDVVAAIEAGIELMAANPPRAERRPKRTRPFVAQEITKAVVLKHLSVSPAFPEIHFKGDQIGTWTSTVKREEIMGSFVNVRKCTATLPDFHGEKVVRIAKTFQQMRDDLATAVTRILQRKASGSRREAA